MFWEKVYTVNRFYDCPVLGIADFNGVPHIFEAILDTPENADAGRFYLMPVGPDLMTLVLDAWELWIKVNDSHDKGAAGSGMPPGAVDGTAREKVLKKSVGERLTAIPEKSVIMKAEFIKHGATQNTWGVHWHDDSE